MRSHQWSSGAIFLKRRSVNRGDVQLWIGRYSNSTFQYASLMKLRQLSSRIEVRVKDGFHLGRTGCLRSFILACCGVRSALTLLQVMHANTQFSQVDGPPCERGTTWSIVNSSPSGWRPQYWQVNRSRLKIFRRLKVTDEIGTRSN